MGADGKSGGKGKGKKKAAARPAAKPVTSLLTRLFKRDAKAGGAAAKGAGKANGSATRAKARPLTPLERSIQEIKHMAKVGESDPERLAMMLSRLLGQEKEKQRQAREQFDRMVWDIVHKDESDGDAAGPAISQEPPPGPSAD